MTDALSTIHRLRALSVDLNQLADAFARRNHLHPTDVRALICLLDADRADIAATPGWLGRQLGINSASVTALIDRMQKAGHVRRKPDATDRRRVQLKVTPEASELGWAFFGPMIGAAVNEIEQFSPDECAAVDKFLTTMQKVAAAVHD